MSTDKRYNTREFSYTKPIMYQGEYYPSADSMISDEYGNKTKGSIFVDADGQYYTKDKDNNVFPVMLVNNLDDVVVTAQNKQVLPAMFNNYLTMSNDRTKVNNLPHREYNTHLKERTERGAKEHSLWDKEHPNLSAWRDFTTAIPFGVAAIPLVGGGGSALLETGMGQAAKHGLAALMENPVMEVANNAVGLGFAGKGVNDLSQGKFTPETVMDLMGFPLGIKSEINIAKGLKRNDFNLGKYLTDESPIPRKIKEAGAKRYINFIENPEYKNRLEEAGLEKHWQDMKDLANKQLNGFNYFPGRTTKGIIYNNPNTQGVSGIGIFNPYYGITIKKDLFPNKVMPTLDHEIAHWATKNAGVENKGFLGDIMRYNENISPNKPWEDVLREEIQTNPSITVDYVTELDRYYNYLIDPQEKRARAMSIYQQAKDHNMTTDNFVDMWTDQNGRIYSFAPEQLRDMSMVFTKDNLKKYLNKVLGMSAPVGVGTTLMYNQNKQNYDR